MAYAQYGLCLRIKGDVVSAIASDGAEARKWYERSVRILEQAAVIDRASVAAARRQDLQRGRRPDEVPERGLEQVYANLGLSLEKLGQYAEALGGL